MNNPPAFPNVQPAKWNDIGDHTYDSGMTLRDYFAAAALPALVKEALDLDHQLWDATGEHAYLIADAMLKARDQ